MHVIIPVIKSIAFHSTECTFSKSYVTGAHLKCELTNWHDDRHPGLPVLALRNVNGESQDRTLVSAHQKTTDEGGAGDVSGSHEHNGTNGVSPGRGLNTTKPHLPSTRAFYYVRV